MFAHPKSTERAISDNFTLRSRISLEGMKQSANRNGVINHNPFHVRLKMVNFGPVSQKFKLIIFTHSKLSPQSDLRHRAASRLSYGVGVYSIAIVNLSCYFLFYVYFLYYFCNKYIQPYRDLDKIMLIRPCIVILKTCTSAKMFC